MGWVQVTLAGREQPTIVVFAPPGREPLLGAVTLEEFGLTADPGDRAVDPSAGAREGGLGPTTRRQLPPKLTRIPVVVTSPVGLMPANAATSR